MKGSLKRIIFLFAGIFLLLNGTQSVLASEGGVDAGYTVNINVPENQRANAVSYFNLLTEAGKEQTLEMEITNISDEKKVLEVEVATAVTSHPGVTNYGPGPGASDDDTLIYKMEDLITTESRIEIEKGKTYKLKLQLKMPAEAFEGVLAGGITFREEPKEGEEAESIGGEGVGIINTYAQSIAVLVRESENEITPELVLNDVKADQNNLKNAFTANVQNIQPSFVTEMRTDAWITRKGESEKLYEHNESMLEMAPNSNFNYLIYLDGDKFIAGDYTFTMEAEGSGETWLLTKDFTITPEEAKELNAADMSIEENNLWLFIAIGVGLFVLLLIVILVVRSRKKKKRMYMIMQQRQMQQRQMQQRQMQQRRMQSDQGHRR